MGRVRLIVGFMGGVGVMSGVIVIVQVGMFLFIVGIVMGLVMANIRAMVYPKAVVMFIT